MTLILVVVNMLAFVWEMRSDEAAIAQVIADSASTVPRLGASRAIAAVMGAFLVTYPGDRIKVLWFFGIFTHVTTVPAFVLIGP